MSLWCLIIDHDRALVGGVFKVACDPGLEIGSFIAKAREWVPKSLDEDINLFVVYHIPELNPGMDDDDLATAVAELDLSKAKVRPNAVVKDVISDPANMILIIKKPARQEPVSAFKRPRSPSNPIDQTGPLKRAKFLNVAPSSGAQPSHYKGIQKDPDERLLDDRPQPDVDVAPITLLYGPFGQFDDIFTGRVLPPAHAGIIMSELEERIDEFAKEMLTFFEDEHKRRGAALEHLAKIGFDLKAAYIGTTAFNTDGHSDIEGVIDTSIEIKNEMSDAKTLPYVQNALYIGQSHKFAVKDLCNRWRVPALCITLVGPDIQFWGTILLGHQYRTVSLTPPLSCAPLATNGRDRKELYSAFAAALVLRTRIRDDLESHLGSSLPPPRILKQEEFFFPAVSTIRKYGCNDDVQQDIEFKILRHHDHSHRHSHRHLYVAKVASEGELEGREILVKFSRSYCPELHDYCSRQRHGPQLYGFQPLPGGWFAIAMQYNPDALGISLVPYSSHMEEQLTKLVEGFHNEGLVHGDLRCANILCDESRGDIWLVDFDWGGPVGGARYPVYNLNEDLRIGRDSQTLEITKVDDKRILRRTLDILKDLYSN